MTQLPTDGPNRQGLIESGFRRLSESADPDSDPDSDPGSRKDSILDKLKKKTEKSNLKGANDFFEKTKKNFREFETLRKRLKEVTKDNKAKNVDTEKLTKDLEVAMKSTMDWKTKFVDSLASSNRNIGKLIIATEKIKFKINKFQKELHEGDASQRNLKTKVMLQDLVQWGSEERQYLEKIGTSWSGLVKEAARLSEEWKRIAESCDSISISIRESAEKMSKNLKNGKKNAKNWHTRLKIIGAFLCGALLGLGGFFLGGFVGGIIGTAAYAPGAAIGVVVGASAGAYLGYTAGRRAAAKKFGLEEETSNESQTHHIVGMKENKNEEQDENKELQKVLEEVKDFANNVWVYEEQEGSVEHDYFQIQKEKMQSNIDPILDNAKKDLDNAKELEYYQSPSTLETITCEIDKFLDSCKEIKEKIDSIWDVCLKGNNM